MGYLTAAIIGAISWVLLQFGEKFTTLVDMVFPYVTRTLMGYLAEWSAPLDFCLWQVIVVAAAVVLLATVVLMVIMRWNPVRWLGWVAAVCSVVYLLHTVVFGLNYYAGDLADDIRLEKRDYSVAELADATQYYRDMANLLAVQVHRDAEGNVKFADFGVLAEQAEDGFDTLVHEYSYPIFAGSTLPVKELGWADMYTSMGITGVTMGLTGEAAVNPQIPDVTLPFTMCHEMAHRMSIATERDANFAAFLASMANEDIEFRYSAYFMAYRYCYNALLTANNLEASGAAARIASQASPQLQQDMRYYSQFFNSNRDEKATKVADTVNDTYLKTSGDEAGIRSYGDVCDLLVNWHYQTVILPTLMEDVKIFDPYDESQVDLSGITNAKEQATQPEDENPGGVG
jgi:hypothetical protein